MPLIHRVKSGQWLHINGVAVQFLRSTTISIPTGQNIKIRNESTGFEKKPVQQNEE